jgi:hypothetical protein
MKSKHLIVGWEYKTPVLTVVTLETESGMVLCASSGFEDIPELDSDDEF